MALYDRRTIVRGMGLGLAGALAGCGGTGGDGATTETATGTPTETPPPDPLSIDHTRFVTGRPEGYRQYTRVSDTTYQSGETIWIYFEPSGVDTEPTGNDQVEISLMTTLTVRRPDGSKLKTLSQDVSETFASDSNFDELFLFWNVNPDKGLPTGEYSGEISVTDEVADQTAETTVSFRLESQQTDMTDVFRDAISTELTVGIRRLRVTNGTVELFYETPDAYDSENATGQIGYIAGSYAALIDEGWNTSELQAEFIDGNGERYRFTVEAATAQEYIDGDITQDEFVTRIFETLSPADEPN